MKLQYPSHTLATPKQTRKPLIAAACGALVALVTATGIGTWQVTERGGNETAAVMSQPVQPVSATDRFDAMGGVAEQLRQQNLPVSLSTADRFDHMGGVAEQLREHATAGTGAADGFDSIGGVAEQMRERAAPPATAVSSRWDTIGGMAEQMRDFPHLVP